ncbi:phosphatidylinositol-specific phospholipase C domain-containing protein [Microbulbifer celer]|uniref:Phosphatidylinositol-specific phospholipase C domain-containing protein n=1 Tax=Microbulbifer celer TaxID=435905 RepID=A0ABW3UC42_9GAMM|nr:phosphatidylinositol-specific phospholipase C domain-containing protein [Microbulbifer celer]UFN57476.1 phosphatidylinositol-specific phospholipase C1-like protein [Microbulbifer celer]
MKTIGGVFIALFLFTVPALAGNPVLLPESRLLYSHNSYLATDKRWQGMHLAQQLSAGIRILELDIWDRAGRIAHDEKGERQHCYWIAECLAQVDRWSQAHPDHSPIILLFELTHTDGKAGGEPSMAKAAEVVRGKIDALFEAINPLSGSQRIVTYTQSTQPLASLRGKLLIGVYRKFNTQLFRADYPGASPRQSLAISDALDLLPETGSDTDYAAEMIRHSVLLAPRWLGKDSHGITDRDWLGEQALRRRFASLWGNGDILRLVKQDDWSYRSPHSQPGDLLIAHFLPQPQGVNIDQILEETQASGLGIDSATTLGSEPATALQAVSELPAYRD